MSNTIAAISTALAPAGIGVIRISGDMACEIASKVFSSKVPITEISPNTALYGHVHRADTLIDEAVATVFRSPHSYTGEDVVELSCHGGLYILNETLKAIFDCGAVPADAGEFTKRAFLNGKLDLTQAESVMSLIGAQNSNAAGAALSAKSGHVSKRILNIRTELISLDAALAAWVDYPEEDYAAVEPNQLCFSLSAIASELKTLIDEFDFGQLVCHGIDTVIAGKPNVGKSTLMNLLSRADRSIISDIPGTTRDVVESVVSFGDIILRLADTAGIRTGTDDSIERIGVERSLSRIDSAQLVIAVFDSSSEFDDFDIQILERIKNKKTLVIVNKTDLPKNADFSAFPELFDNALYVSAKDDSAFYQVESAIKQLISYDSFDPGAAILVTERQRSCCLEALRSINDALDAAEIGFTLDAVGVCIDSALDALLALTGERATVAVVDEVFSKFCVGK